MIETGSEKESADEGSLPAPGPYHELERATEAVAAAANAPRTRVAAEKL